MIIADGMLPKDLACLINEYQAKIGTLFLRKEPNSKLQLKRPAIFAGMSSGIILSVYFRQENSRSEGFIKKLFPIAIIAFDNGVCKEVDYDLFTSYFEAQD